MSELVKLYHPDLDPLPGQDRREVEVSASAAPHMMEKSGWLPVEAPKKKSTKKETE